MIQKKYFIIFVSLVYVVLIVLFFKLQKETSYAYDYDESCFFEKPCVRFCCESGCDQSYIDKHFNASLLPDDDLMEWNGTQGIVAHFERPNCSLKLVDFVESWEFKSVN
jgi:hypothetical protein